MNTKDLEKILLSQGGKLTKDGWEFEGSLNLSNRGLEKLPKISRVGGGFYCSRNSLTSLEGSPQSVGGVFDCSHNNLTSLKGAPQFVRGDFYCDSNSLTSLEGAPQSVGGNFWCGNNSLTSLKGCPLIIKGEIYCNDNKFPENSKPFQKLGNICIALV